MSPLGYFKAARSRSTLAGGGSATFKSNISATCAGGQIET
jgi:hypothetical protein